MDVVIFQNEGPEQEDDALFPILKGESVGESGEYNGNVLIICEAKDFDRSWSSNDIPVLAKGLEEFVIQNPGLLDNLFSSVSATLVEFGQSISEMAAMAYVREVICVVGVPDAVKVLEDGMHIRVVAHENEGWVYFIE